jgi:hypothetical protein
MTATALAIECCAHCGRPLPAEDTTGRTGWDVHDVLATRK